MGNTLIYTKGSMVYCQSCGDHVTTFKEDLYFETLFSESHLDPQAGQGPWNVGEACACRKCGSTWLFNGRILDFNPYGSDVIKIQRGDYDSIQSQFTFLQGKSGRESTLIAGLADEFYNKERIYGLTNFEKRIYDILKGHFENEIQVLRKRKRELMGQTQ